MVQIERNLTRTKNHGATGLLFSVGWIEDEQQNPFSFVCSQRTSLNTLNNIYEEKFFYLNICSIDFQPVRWNKQHIQRWEKTAHKPAQLTKAVLERVSLT